MFGSRTIQRGGATLKTATRLPALLVSYVYREPFLRDQAKYRYRDWVLDSGAFSAYVSGAVIENRAFIEEAKRLLATDKTLTEVFALDVIGDYKTSLRNCEEAWEQGLPAIPTYHAGEPESHLRDIAKRFPKIALGGVVGSKNKLSWAKQCFARVYPKRIHGFGSEKAIMALNRSASVSSSRAFTPA
jgi:hypothetical protein